MKKQIVVLLIAVLTTVSMQLMAQTQRQQKERIRNGQMTGQLTKAEAQQLKAEQKKIRAEKRMAKADGKVTARERKMLRAEKRKASAHIVKEKHDAEHK